MFFERKNWFSKSLGVRVEDSVKNVIASYGVTSITQVIRRFRVRISALSQGETGI